MANDPLATVGEVLTSMPATKPFVPAIAPQITPMQMLQMAVEKGAQLDVMERLMALQERWEANEARKAYVAAITSFKSEQHAIIKTKEVSFGTGKTSYKHATLDNVCDVVGAGLAEHQLSHRWETDQSDPAAIKVTCVLTHVLGHSERVTLQGPADNSGAKNSIQAVGSTVTYLCRYTLLAATGLATKDQDDDAKTAQAKAIKISPDQKEKLIELQIEVSADTAKFLKHFKIESLDEMPQHRYQEAVDLLNRKKDEAKKASK